MNMIFLIGMPGSGKTYWANWLSESYSLERIDTDEYIVKQEEKSIQQIFEKDGEPYFRMLEEKYLAEIVKNNFGRSAIVACGGGMPAYGNNLRMMKENGCVVYLQMDIDVLSERMGKDIERPLFAGVQNIEEVLTKMYQTRRKYYEQADYKLSADRISIANFESIIEKCINKQ